MACARRSGQILGFVAAAAVVVVVVVVVVVAVAAAVAVVEPFSRDHRRHCCAVETCTGSFAHPQRDRRKRGVGAAVAEDEGE